MSHAPCAPSTPVARGAGNPLYELSTRLSERVAELRKRHGLKKLLDYQDYILDDMGVCRVDIDWALSLPLSADAEAELRRYSKARRKGGM